ncbi:MAG TPA: helix-turn-helix transcriptional regulator [Usitatibacteraceae bacterium]
MFPSATQRPIHIDFGVQQFRAQLQQALFDGEQIALRQQLFEVGGITFAIAIVGDAQRFSHGAALRLGLDGLRLQFCERRELRFHFGKRRDSRFHFHRQFKKSVGMTVRKYIQLGRIERAKLLLLKSDMSLAEIAGRAGFADQSHFTATFRRAISFTPKSYRDTK